MTVGMIAIGSLSVGYVLSQAALDKFINGVVGFSSKFKGDDEDV
jgi:hypothetical protein